MTAQLADVRFERRGPIAVAALSGEVDMSNAPSVRQRIAEQVTPDDDTVILDLSGLTFIDSAGLHIVFELSAVLGERRQRLIVCAPPGSQVERTIGIVGLPTTVSVLQDCDEAIQGALGSTTATRPFPPHDD